MLSKVYWNNVCLLTNLESSFIRQTKEAVPYFPFDFEFYGLGQSYSLTEKIKLDLKQKEIGGDIIVTTDLEVFQDNQLFTHFRTFQQDLSLPVRKEIMKTSIPHPDGFIQPFIVIPLVIVANTRLLAEHELPLRLEDFLHPSFRKRYAFGGLHNSAGRSLLKSLWYLYGAQVAEQFTSGAVVTSMPAQAFQKVMKGEVAAALVPTIFALRQGIHNLKAFWPLEGAVAIPSYVVAKQHVPQQDLDVFKTTILGCRHQEQLRNTGDIIPCHPDVPLSSSASENACRLLYPAWSFYKTLDNEKFNLLCEKYNPFA